MTTLKTIKMLEFQWLMQDPFLFCAHHEDKYPEGTDNQGPAMPLSRRNLGQDFDLSNDWKMYHGHEVPGFPEHPHRGFETVTVVLEGIVDHFDSRGAAGRYGNGDVQWMTAGSGMQHAEMFPLIHKDKPNPLHLFQIWLNLPKKNKFVKPHYKMLWNEQIPIVISLDDNNKTSSIRLIAGQYEGVKAPKPAPDSWAADPENHLEIWLVTMEAGASLDLSETLEAVNRSIYFYEGSQLTINTEVLDGNHQAFMSSQPLHIVNGKDKAQFLYLQARPIQEPVVQYGPFVMNTREEIKQAYADYQETHFGGWPWDRSDPTHHRSKGRFAIYDDGRKEFPVEDKEVE